MTSPSSLLPFAAATQIQCLDSCTYGAEFSQKFSIGTVPNGGYVASHFLKVARLHLTERGQTDTLTAHYEFLDRASIGPAVLVVEELKIGRQTSVLHLTLYQSGLLGSAPWVKPGTKKTTVAYITNTNFDSEVGLTLETKWELHPPPPPVDLGLLGQGKDANWIHFAIADTVVGKVVGKIRSLNLCQFHVPRQGQHEKSIMDMWLRLPQGERFTADSLGWVVDLWPTIVESYRPNWPETEPFKYDEQFWYPTVVLNMDVKKRLPEEGSEWLFIRTRAKQIKNGRCDLEVLVFDEAGELVVISNHVNLILSVARNLAGRKAKSML